MTPYPLLPPVYVWVWLGFCTHYQLHHLHTASDVIQDKSMLCAADYVVRLQYAVEHECVQYHANMGPMILVSWQHVVHGLQSCQRMLTVAMHFAGVQFLRKRHA